jgi:hypothetical protein
MSDDFGTVSAKRVDRSREIEVLRQHRASLAKMLGDIDQQIRELELMLPEESPGARALVTTPDYESPIVDGAPQPGGGMRVVMILGVALLALVLIAWLVWRASSDRKPKIEEQPTVAESTTTIDTTTTAPATVQEIATEQLTVRPASQDYGLVRKGTRATRQFEVTNTTDEPMPIAISRSACRCLYYEHASVVAPKGKESITVTIDGAKAKAGTLRESLKVTKKTDPAVGTSFDVIATVR